MLNKELERVTSEGKIVKKNTKNFCKCFIFGQKKLILNLEERKIEEKKETLIKK